jgi:hypothetical protein
MKFSDIQKNFHEEFNRFLEKHFKGDQIALAKRLDCDQSSVSRWLNRVNAPPDYACRLLLKELGSQSIKHQLGRRLQHLREDIFKASVREFAWEFGFDDLSHLEAVESGKKELPRDCIEKLMGEFNVSSEFLDYGETPVFCPIVHDVEILTNYLAKGFRLHLVTPPAGHEDYRRQACRFILDMEAEGLRPCLTTSAVGSFKSSGGGRLVIEQALFANEKAALKQSVLPRLPTVWSANSTAWNDLEAGRFYQRKVAFGPGSVDFDGSQRLDSLTKDM